MKIIKPGETYGIYKVEGFSKKLTKRGNPYVICICQKCGKKVELSGSKLTERKLQTTCNCLSKNEILEKKAEEIEKKKFFNKIGKVCLCGACEHLFTCVRHKYNIIDKSFMKKYTIEYVGVGKKTKVIMVYKCDRFKYDL